MRLITMDFLGKVILPRKLRKQAFGTENPDIKLELTVQDDAIIIKRHIEPTSDTSSTQQ